MQLLEREEDGISIKVKLEARAAIAQANRRSRGVIEWEVEQTYIWRSMQLESVRYQLDWEGDWPSDTGVCVEQAKGPAKEVRGLFGAIDGQIV